MEEQTFLDTNPYWNATDGAQQEALKTTKGPSAIDRWLDPGIAEWGQFNRENYFVDKANAFNEYMYNKQNEYNTPAAQMERMKEAGINPLLAAGAISGNGNTAAQPAAGAQGTATMNGANINPIDQMLNIAKTIGTLAQGGNEAGKLFGFGAENKATIKQIEATANKAAEEADFTFWQKRQFRRTMRLMYDQAEKNLELLEANIKNLQATYEKLQQEKFNIASDTNLKVAQTGETLETTKNIAYKNAEEEFKKQFREIFGIQLNESDMSMLVQAVLGGHGDKIIESIVDCFGQIAKSLTKNAGKPIVEGAQDIINKTRDAHKKYLEDKVIQKSERITKKEHKRFERALQQSWNYMGSEQRKKYGFDFNKFRTEQIKKRERKGYSGKW